MTSNNEVESNLTMKYSLDDILRIVGQFGRYQICLFILLCFGTGMANQFAFNWVFTTSNVNYRCRIPECESSTNPEHSYNPKWVKSAIPFENNLPKSCTRYVFRNSSRECTSSENFDRLTEVECDDWIFDNYENTIVNEVGIYSLV